MKAKQRAKLRRKLRTPDKNGVYRYPLPHSFFVRMIGFLPSEENHEYWRLYDRQHLEGKQLSETDQQRLADLGERARQLWHEQAASPPESPGGSVTPFPASS